jgi:XTP/dITP diphosphohydrolase
MMDTLVLASNNKGKIKEFGQLLQTINITVKPQGDWQVLDAEEIGTTFVENAIIKARHAAEITGLPALADDSGLVVDALQGGPGVHTSRYAGVGADEVTYTKKLLDNMQAVPDDARGASFVCVLVLMHHAKDPIPLIAQATWRGEITRERRGEHGFGYDPVFFVPEEGCTSAELAPERKHQLSHRGRALQQLLQLIKAEQ